MLVVPTVSFAREQGVHLDPSEVHLDQPVQNGSEHL